jgi:transcriptional regulator with XRE-family HTH domain
MPTENNARRSTFAENLIAARTKAGMSQAELAKRSKISQSFLSYVERGEKRISTDRAEKIADALGISICKLLHPPEK